MSEIINPAGGSGSAPGALTGAVYNTNYNYLVPTNAATITLNNTDYQVILDPANDLGSLNLIMPPAPFDGQMIQISTSMHRIGGFAMLPNAGQSVVDSPNALSDGSPVWAIYRAADTTWFVTYSVPFLPANGNLTFFVATTGSDSHPGTASLPFATLQQAINVASQYDYQNNWTVTINVAAGTYDGSVTPSLNATIGGPFKNFSNSFMTINGSGTATCIWAKGGLQIDNITLLIGGFTFTDGAQQSAINPIANCLVDLKADMSFGFTGAGTAYYPFFSEGQNTFIFAFGHTFTYTSATIASFFLGGPGSLFFANSHIILPATVTVFGNAFFDIGGQITQSGGGFAFIGLSGVTWTNFGGVVGPRLNAYQGAVLISANGELTDWPGNSQGTIDSTVQFSDGNTPAKTGLWANTSAGQPTTSNIPTSCWGVWKDTSGGGVYIAENDSGTIRLLPFIPGIVTIPDAVNQTFDAANGATATARLTATADRTLIAPTNSRDGQRVVIEHTASGGARTLTLGAGAGAFTFGSDITTLTQTASGKTDEVLVIYNLPSNLWRVSAFTKGF